MAAVLFLLLLSLFLGNHAVAMDISTCPCRVSASAVGREDHVTRGRLNGVETEFCVCTQATVEERNQRVIYPVLVKKLLLTPFFRYAHVSMDEQCMLWPTQGMCMNRQCAVELLEDKVSLEQWKAIQEELQKMGRGGTNGGKKDLKAWFATPKLKEEEKERNNFEQRFVFVDLMANPERFTGYSGAEPQRLWQVLYSTVEIKDKVNSKAMQMMTYLLQRLISGIHASINSHITFDYLLNSKENRWGPDLDLYRQRVGKEPSRIENLVYAYLFTLRAVDLIADPLLGFPIWTHNSAEDIQTLEILRDLLQSRHEWPLPEDQDLLLYLKSSFFDTSKKAPLYEIARDKFRNVTELLNCVTCDRCRLWSKVQFIGLSTALRITFEPNLSEVAQALSRDEIVALLNTLGRLSHSLTALTTLRPLYS